MMIELQKFIENMPQYLQKDLEQSKKQIKKCKFLSDFEKEMLLYYIYQIQYGYKSIAKPETKQKEKVLNKSKILDKIYFYEQQHDVYAKYYNIIKVFKIKEFEETRINIFLLFRHIDAKRRILRNQYKEIK